jgi:hypothetical protein
MITNPKLLGLLAVAFVAGSFIASPELRAFAANTVFSADIVDGQVMTADLAGNAVTAPKIKDGEVKAAEIATNAVGSSEIAANAVGASEIQGVSKLIFSQCAVSSGTSVPTGATLIWTCSVPGADSDDTGLVTPGVMLNNCFVIVRSVADTDAVKAYIRNDCQFSAGINGSTLSIVVYDT